MASKTAVIVNSRGEAFVRWHSHCSVSESGYETYYSVPYFAKERVARYEECGIWPSDVPKDEPWITDRPHVFASEQSARRAMRRMSCFAELAVVS